MAEPLLIAFAVDMAGDDRTLRGLAVPFDQDSSPSMFRGFVARHRFRRGAFTRTIAERGSKVRLLVEHEERQLPVGRAVELREESDGLHVEFEVAATARGDEALTLVRDGYVTGLSVSVDPIEWSEDGGRVEHTESRLREISLVNEPAFVDAGVAASASDSSLPVLRVDHAKLLLSLVDKDFRYDL